MRKLFILPLLFFQLMGCGDKHHYPTVLLMADSLCEVNPKAAIDSLDRLAEQMTQASEPDRMYYRLLCIKAADKAYIPHTSDSLIRTVLDYYEHGGDQQLLPIAYYYGGRVNMDLGDAPQAVDLFHKALDFMGDKPEFTKTKRFVYTQIGELFVKQSLYDDALNAYKSAYDCNTLLKDTVEMIFTLTDIASVLNFKNDRTEALDSLKKAHYLSEITGNNEALPNITAQLSRTFLHLHQPDSAHKYIKLALGHPSITTLDATYNIAIDVYKELGLQDSAMYFCRLLLQSGNVFSVRYSLQQLAEYESYNHNTATSMHYYHQWTECNDSVEKLNASRQAAQMNAIYNYQLREKENNRLNTIAQKRKIFISISIIVIFFLMILGTILWRYQKKKQLALTLKLEKYERIATEYQQKLEEKKPLPLVAFLNTDLHWQLKKSASEGIRISNEQIKELTLFFNREMPTFREELNKLTRLNEYQFLICMLVVVGFKTADIARLLCKTPQAINSVRQRLYDKAFGKKGTPQKWDNIIYSLSAV